MASEELEVLAAACKNKEVYQIISEDNEIFGPYADVFDLIKEHYAKYKSSPSFDILRKKVPDLDDVNTTEPTKYYLENLKRTFLRGRIEHTILRATKGLKIDTPDKVLEVIQKDFARLTRLTATAVDVNIMDTDVAREHYDQVAATVDENGSIGIPTGFVGMDSAYETGMAPGHLIYAMGFSGAGKSWFAALMAVRAHQHGVKPMIVSLEMTPPAMRDRVYTMMGEGTFKNSDLTKGQINHDEFDAWAKKQEGKPEFPVISGTAGQDITPNYIQSKIDQHKPGLVVIDYQQLLLDNEKTQQMTPRMTALSRELKLLAVNNNIPIIVISSVTDSDQGRDVAPTIEQLAWARAMEYNADMIFAVHKKKDTNIMEIIGRKNRFGPLWALFIDVDLNLGTFKENFDLAGVMAS